MYTVVITYRLAEGGVTHSHLHKSDVIFFQLTSYVSLARRLSKAHFETEVEITIGGRSKYRATFRSGLLYKQLTNG